MEKLTKDDVKEMGMLELSHNQVFVKNREAWYRDYDMEITVRDLAQAMFARNGIECPSENDEFDEYMLELLQDGYETIDGMIALYYNALWAFAEVREKLKAYEDTGLEPKDINKYFDGHVKEINRLRDIVTKYDVLKHQERLIILPCRVEDTVYAIDVKGNIHECKVYNITTNVYAKENESSPHWVGFEIKSDRFGKTVFLTEEEAKKALEGK